MKHLSPLGPMGQRKWFGLVKLKSLEKGSCTIETQITEKVCPGQLLQVYLSWKGAIFLKMRWQSKSLDELQWYICDLLKIFRLDSIATIGNNCCYDDEETGLLNKQTNKNKTGSFLPPPTSQSFSGVHYWQRLEREQEGKTKMR